MSEFQRHQPIKPGQEASFGRVFAAVFFIVAMYPLWFGQPLRVWALLVCVGFLLASQIAPKLLSPLNQLWFHFGLLLGRIVSPIAMGILYFLVITPFGLVRRMLGKDSLNYKISRSATTYWITRDTNDDTMADQF